MKTSREKNIYFTPYCPGIQTAYSQLSYTGGAQYTLSCCLSPGWARAGAIWVSECPPVISPGGREIARRNMVPISETGQKYSISFHRDNVQILCVSCILRRKEWVGKIIWRFMRISPHSNPFSPFYQLYISQTFWLARHTIYLKPLTDRGCAAKNVSSVDGKKLELSS